MDEFEPYKEKKRERRIRNRLRMTAKGRSYFKIRHSYYFTESAPHFYEEAEMHGRKFHDNLCVCSCDQCCNPRRAEWTSGRHGLTLQERRAIQNDNEYFEELGMSEKQRKP